MSRFPTSGHLISWAGLCPRNDESAGKRRSTRAKGTYLRAQFLRLKTRRGPGKAILAVAASMLTAAYFMLRDGVEYRDLGPDHFDRHDRTKTANRLIRRLEALGLKVQVQTAA
jgi:hypothetical protein